jgi:hypothetical protein
MTTAFVKCRCRQANDPFQINAADKIDAKQPPLAAIATVSRKPAKSGAGKGRKEPGRQALAVLQDDERITLGVLRHANGSKSRHGAANTTLYDGRQFAAESVPTPVRGKKYFLLCDPFRSDGSSMVRPEEKETHHATETRYPDQPAEGQGWNAGRPDCDAETEHRIGNP